MVAIASISHGLAGSGFAVAPFIKRMAIAEIKLHALNPIKIPSKIDVIILLPLVTHFVD